MADETAAPLVNTGDASQSLSVVSDPLPITPKQSVVEGVTCRVWEVQRYGANEIAFRIQWSDETHHGHLMCMDYLQYLEFVAVLVIGLRHVPGARLLQRTLPPGVRYNERSEDAEWTTLVPGGSTSCHP